MNVQAFEELKRVLSSVPESEFNIGLWHHCACGHASRDEWFQRRGFWTCYSFDEAAAFFRISRDEAVWLFSGPSRLISPREEIERIDALLAKNGTANEAAKQSRRQAVIDGLLATANTAARKAKSATTLLIAMFF